MSYLVLARKYRPQKFRDVIGQEHLTELLEKSISCGRIAQAYLFCGPRGIGKTSCARILAKSLNCQKGPTLDPCGECSSCKEISGANSFDVLEVDGASNRGIDEIRTLRENVKFAPTYGRYKIYIVDEVHMLTMEAFNALLKTLEEPPAHVKFILATTSPNKVPATIISRCQRFDFKRISIPTMMKTMADLCQKENFTIDEAALFAIAKASSGSLRDALSVLDQVSSLSTPSGSADSKENNQGGIQAKDIFSMLGLVETQFLFDLVDAIASKNCAQALTIFDQIIEQGKDLKQLGLDLTEHFRHLMIIKIGGKALGGLVDYPVSTKELLLTQTEKFSLKEILKAMEILVNTQDISRILGSQRTPLEIAFAKLTYVSESPSSGMMSGKEMAIDSRPETSILVKAPQPTIKPSAGPSMVTSSTNASSATKSTGANPNSPFSSVPEKQKSSGNALGLHMLKDQKGQVGVVSPTLEEPKGDVFNGDQQTVDLEKIRRSWDALTYALSREKMSVATFLQEGTPVDFKGAKLTIGFAKEASFHKESLEERSNVQLVEKVFAEKLRTRIIIEFKLVDDPKPQDHEPLIKTALETFKGKVVNKWHNE